MMSFTDSELAYIAERKDYYWSLPYYQGAPKIHDYEIHLLAVAELNTLHFAVWQVGYYWRQMVKAVVSSFENRHFHN